MNQMFVPSNLTRRQFLKASGATGLAVLGSSLYGGSFPNVLETATVKAASEDKWITTTCWIGKQGCVMQAHVVDGVATDLRGYPDDTRSLGRLCLKGSAQLMSMYDPYRLKTPLVRTNAKGEPGKWKEVSWDEALKLVADKANEVRARDPKKLIFQTTGLKQSFAGRSSFMGAMGNTQTIGSIACYQTMGDGHGYTIGMNSGSNADLRYTKYVLVWGTSLKDGGPSGVCWTTWQTQMREARGRGMKAVLIDPRREAGANMVDEWLPIKPTTDLALLLAIANVLIAKGYVDEKFLLDATNAPFLLKADGHLLKKDNKELVWDTQSKSAQPFDAKDVVPALKGSYTVDGAAVKTVFEALKEHVAKNTPEWAAEICGLPAASIQKVALDLGENAHIGSTIVVDGVTLPYRPIGMMSYHGLSQQELGFQTGRACDIVMMLLGAVHAVGGHRVGFNNSVDASFKALDTIKLLDKPRDVWLTGTKWYPMGGARSLVYHVINNPQKYGAEALIPEMLITLGGNPFLSNVAEAKKALAKIKFIAGLECHLIEELDSLADVVFPAATLDKYDGLINITDTYHEGYALRLPVIPSLYQSKADMEIYMGISEKAGVLLGKDGFLDRLNTELRLKEPNLIDINKPITVREVFDKWAKQQGKPEGIAYFEQKGLLLYPPIPANRRYAPAWNPPYGGIKYRMYGESLLGYQEEMKKMGVGKIYYQDFTGFPVWREPTMNQSPVEYDLTFIDYKSLPFFHSQATFNPLLHEQNPEQRLQMNSKTAAAKGLKDGDWVTVESHNAVTQETLKVKVRVQALEGMRPDTVGFYHGFGHWVHPVAKGSGPASGELYFSGEGYTATPSNHSVCRVRVKVTKA
jgi:anaerobic selenocysteine-containing dehydrogenase